MDENPRIADLRKKLEKDPGSRLFAQLAEELRKDGRLDEAISVAQSGLERNPNYPSARLTLARALLDAGRPAEARPELENVVKASPDNILATKLLGEALDALGSQAEALSVFEKALQLSPGDKSLTERARDLRSRSGSVGSRPAAPAAAAAPSAPLPVVAVRAAAVPPGQPAAPAPPPWPAAATVRVVPAVPTPARQPASAPPPPAPVHSALDRDLASGTISPGSLNIADLMNFDAPGLPPIAQRKTESAPEVVDVEQTLGFGEMQAPSEEPPPSLATLPAVSFVPAPPPAPAAVPFVTFPPLVGLGENAPEVSAPPASEQADQGGQTLPVTSLTLADLYLQQGLKAEAAAVLSQVLRAEPGNPQALAKLESVGGSVVSAPFVEAAEEFVEETLPPTLPPSVRSPIPAAPPKTPPAIPVARGERSIRALKAFLGAAEREAAHQRASEQQTPSNNWSAMA